MKYFAASMVIAVAAAVYGLFGHGVYSYYMTYAFMIPLLAGALPHLLTALKGADQKTMLTGLNDVQLAFVATLTAGSLLKGVLDIYGTTNRLLIAYPVMAAIILVVVLAAKIRNWEIPGFMKNK